MIGGLYHRRNKLASIHQFGVFVGIVPRTGDFVVLTPEGAMAVRTIHRLSEDRKWDTVFVSKVKGTPRDLKANAGDDINDGEWTLVHQTHEMKLRPASM